MAGSGATANPALSVVVSSPFPGTRERAVASIIESAAAVGAVVEIVVVRSSDEPSPPTGAGTTVVTTFPVGVSHARNQGAGAARSPLLAFVAGDADVVPRWVAAVLGAFAEGADVVAGPIESDPGPGRAPRRAGATVGGHAGRRPRPWALADGANIAVRAERFRQVGGFDLRMGIGGGGRAAETSELVAILAAGGARLTWRPDMVLRRRAFDGAEPAPPSQRADGFGTGRMVRRLRAPSLAAAYAADLARAAAGAASHGDLRSIGATAANLAGFAAGLATPDRWTSPAAPLAHLPAPVRRALGRRRLRPWPVPHRVPLHLLWQAGPDLVLHLYVGVGAGFDAGAAARAAARWSGLGGVPAIVARADDEDVAWVLEERLRGRPLGREWWTAPADWIVALAGTGGRPLRDTAWWSGDMARPTEASALADLPAVVVHGDVQPKNLLVDATGAVGVLDWEGAIDAGPPGFDLLFLAVAGQPGVAARRAAVDALAAGRDPAGTDVHDRLRAVGLDGVTTRAALRLAVHEWAATESARARMLGGPRQRPEYGPVAATSRYTAS